MTLQRRGFLAGILAAASAPAIVSAESLMKIIVPEQAILLPSKLRWLAADFDVDTCALGSDDFTVELWLYQGRIGEFRLARAPISRHREDILHNGIGPQWGGRYTPNFVKPEIAFDLSDTVPADGKWDYVNVGPNGMSLEKW